MFCRKCGAELKEGTKFCVKCGTPIQQNSNPQVVNTQTTQVTGAPNPQTTGMPNPGQMAQKPVSPAGQLNAGNTTQQMRQMKNPAMMNPMQNQPVKKKNSNTGLIVAIILLIFLILGIVGGVIYFTVFNTTAIEEIFNRDDKNDNESVIEDDETENTETEEVKETEVANGTEPSTEASTEGAATETTTETAASVASGTELAIEDQTYKVDLVPHGSVKFVPFTPANEGSDAIFKIMKKDKVITVLPPYYENNSLAATGAVFVDVEEVFFKDYNIDGVDDIFVNCLYKYSADSTSTFMECRVYRGSAEGDYYMQTGLSNVGTDYAQTDGTIGYYVDELRDLYADYDLPFSNSISYSKEDLEMLTEEQLMKARNEIYARHGYRFENEELWKHFTNRDWYQPYTYTVPDSALNEHEIHNRDLIIELEEKYY